MSTFQGLFTVRLNTASETANTGAGTVELPAYHASLDMTHETTNNGTGKINTVPGMMYGVFAPVGFINNSGNADPTGLAIFNNDLYFAANDGVNGVELWRTINGVSVSLVKDISTGTNSSSPDNFIVYNGQLYFAANGDQGRELWRTDGTTSNTTQVSDINAGVASSSPANMFVLDNSGTKMLYFSADTGANGVELCKYNGTSVAMVSNINAGASSSSPSQFVQIGVNLYFSANTGSGKSLVWMNSSENVASVGGQITVSGADHLVTMGNNLYYTTFSGIDYYLHKTDGSLIGTQLVRLLPGNQNANPNNFTAVGSTLFFTLNDYTHGNELWKTDGSNSGTVIVADLNTSPAVSAGSNPSLLTNVGGTLYFTANITVSGVSQIKLFKCGVGASDIPVEIQTLAVQPKAMVAANQLCYFVMDTGRGDQLYVSDGSSAGTNPVITDSGSPVISPTNLTSLGTSIFFLLNNESGNSELWKRLIAAESGKQTNRLISFSANAIPAWTLEVLGQRG